MTDLRPRRRPAVRGALLALLLAVLAALAGCGDGDTAGSVASSTTPAATAPAATLGFAVVGDSITASARVPDGVRVAGSGSWVPAATGAPLEFTGGWAVAGATTADMRRAVRRVDAGVVVVLAGTNDLLHGVPWSTTRENLLSIVATAGAGRVVLSAVPPADPQPGRVGPLNQRLAALARERGWTFTDPWTGIDEEGRWAAGTSADGVHPVPAVADTVGRRLRAELLAGR